MNLSGAHPRESMRLHAVCYRCRYVGDECATACPNCRFPIILEREPRGGRGVGLEDIFDRTSVALGAPPLPGVDSQPRKAQLLAESRRLRRRPLTSVCEQVSDELRSWSIASCASLLFLGAGFAAAVICSVAL